MQLQQLPPLDRPGFPGGWVHRYQQIRYAFFHFVWNNLLIALVAPEPVQMGEHTITQKHLYTALFVIGLPLLFFASPFMTFFWLVGASGVLILGHASFVEPGVESEYAAVQDTV